MRERKRKRKRERERERERDQAEEERERKRDCFELDTKGISRIDCHHGTVPFTNTGSHSLGGITQTDQSVCFYISEPFFVVPIYFIMRDWYHLNLFF